MVANCILDSGVFDGNENDILMKRREKTVTNRFTTVIDVKFEYSIGQYDTLWIPESFILLLSFPEEEKMKNPITHFPESIEYRSPCFEYYCILKILFFLLFGDIYPCILLEKILVESTSDHNRLQIIDPVIEIDIVRNCDRFQRECIRRHEEGETEILCNVISSSPDSEYQKNTRDTHTHKPHISWACHDKKIDI